MKLNLKKFPRVKPFNKIMKQFVKASENLETYKAHNDTLRDVARSEAEALEAKAIAHQMASNHADKVLKNLKQFMEV